MFWDLNSGTLEGRKGIFGTAGEQSNMTSVQWLSDGTAVTGAGNGQLYLWKDRQLQKTVQVHAVGQAVHSLIIVNDVVVSGGKDNKVIILDSGLNKTKEYLLKSYPRALDIHNNHILVGTRDGNITEITPDGNQTVLMESHNDGEVWGLAVDSDNHLIITTADDNQIKAWNFSHKKPAGTGTIDSVKGPQRKAGNGASTLAVTGTNQQSRGVALNTSNGHVAIAVNDGRVLIRTSVKSLNNSVTVLSDAKE